MTSAPITPLIIKRSTGWASLGLHELWEYKDLLYFMVWRDIKSRYRQTALGPVWIVLQPLVNMILYTVVFGVIASLPSQGQPYSVFSYVALLPWGFFASAFNNGVGGISGGLNLISKVYFPRLVIPLSKIISSLVDLFISFIILLAMLIYYDIRPNWGVALLPVFLFIAAMAGLGAGLWFSGISVKYRDVGQVAGYIIRGWMYASPVVYSIEVVPEEWRTLYRLNPMAGVIEGFRWALLGTNQPPDWLLLGLSTLAAIAALITGLFIFKRVERDIVDVA